MLLSKKTSLRLNDSQSNIIGHMCYAAYKLWNVCNYERHHHKELGLENFPGWYYQKKVHKDDIWYKQLPSQTAQETCKSLDEAWKSFFVLKETGSIENPQPPKYKHSNIPITYVQNGYKHEQGSSVVRLSIPKTLRAYMEKTYGISDKFILAENSIFSSTDDIRQIMLYPPEDGVCDIIVVYGVPDPEMLPDNGRYLGIDMGVHNFMTCYDSGNGSTFIAGRKYLSVCRYHDKEIARVQSQWYSQQSSKGISHPKTSRHIQALHAKKSEVVKDCLHKMTRAIVDYCTTNDIHAVIIGDMTGIRRDWDKGTRLNQEFHALPFRKVTAMLEYKLKLAGISLVRQDEAYSSQVSPLASVVDKEHAAPGNRVKRGLYADGGHVWNADCVGAFNIVRLYLQKSGPSMMPDPLMMKPPYVLKVAV